MENKTKIIATIGPSSCSKTVLKEMMQAGMNVARLNFSHGSHEDHRKSISLIRSLSQSLKKSVAILLDLQGPKIRTGNLEDHKPVTLKTGALFDITSKDIIGNKDLVSTTYTDLPGDVEKGDRLLIDDGLIELKVLSKTDTTITCKVVVGGVLKEKKGINLPEVEVSAPSLTEKDAEDLAFGIKQDVDYFALSFVRKAEDVAYVKELINQANVDTPVIAKIEKPAAVENIDSIIEVADGIMVARGDLGVELNPEQVPMVQKMIITKSMRANKPVITATQMLETMCANAIPTRAEASDVANAIFDGTDAVMLSGETAVGRYPVKAVEMMSRITAEAEKSLFMNYNIQYQKDLENLIVHAVARSAVNIHHEVSAKAILSFSVSGKTTKLISKQRPSSPVYAFSPSQKIFNRSALIWGITPMLIEPIKNTGELIEAGEKLLIDRSYISRNDMVIIVTGLALRKGSTNLIKLHLVGHED